jgi:hypothetical protein
VLNALCDRTGQHSISQYLRDNVITFLFDLFLLPNNLILKFSMNLKSSSWITLKRLKIKNSKQSSNPSD